MPSGYSTSQAAKVTRVSREEDDSSLSRAKRANAIIHGTTRGHVTPKTNGIVRKLTGKVVTKACPTMPICDQLVTKKSS